LLSIPLNMILLFAYNVLVFTSTEDNYLPDTVVASFDIPSEATIKITWNILFVIAGICILYIEILKATRTSYQALIDHLLSLVVFVIFLVELIVIYGIARIGKKRYRAERMTLGVCAVKPSLLPRVSPIDRNHLNR